jgi:hypothetical protein
VRCTREARNQEAHTLALLLIPAVVCSNRCKICVSAPPSSLSSHLNPHAYFISQCVRHLCRARTLHTDGYILSAFHSHHWQQTCRYIPPSGTDMTDPSLPVVGAVLKQVVQVDGASYIAFEGITITHTAPTYLDPYECPSGGDWAIHRGAAFFVQVSRETTLTYSLRSTLGVVWHDLDKTLGLALSEQCMRTLCQLRRLLACHTCSSQTSSHTFIPPPPSPTHTHTP